MAQTSIHIRPVHAGSEEHNQRSKELGHINPELSGNNIYLPGKYSVAEAFGKIKADYQEAHGKKLHAKATPIREGVVVILPTTTMDDIGRACSRLHKEFGIQTFQAYIHRDEGHRDSKTGEWKTNNHAHLLFCWYNFKTHTTVKLNREDMAKIQTIFAEELGMERGTPSTKKGLSAIEFKVQAKEKELQQLVEEGKAASKEAAKLRAEIAKLAEREAVAREKAEAAERAASKEQLKSNLADAGAVVAGIFGKGKIAEANDERDKALKRAENAENLALNAKNDADAARQLAKAQNDARLAAERRAAHAEQNYQEFGRQRYEDGVADGIRQGRDSVRDSIAPLQEKIALHQHELDLVRNKARDEVEQVKADMEKDLSRANNLVKAMQNLNPRMRNFLENYKDMKALEMEDTDIRAVFMDGKKEGVKVVHTFDGERYNVKTNVTLKADETDNKVHVFFGENVLSRLTEFVKRFEAKIIETFTKGRHL